MKDKRKRIETKTDGKLKEKENIRSKKPMKKNTYRCIKQRAIREMFIHQYANKSSYSNTEFGLQWSLFAIHLLIVLHLCLQSIGLHMLTESWPYSTLWKWIIWIIGLFLCFWCVWFVGLFLVWIFISFAFVIFICAFGLSLTLFPPVHVKYQI